MLIVIGSYMWRSASFAIGGGIVAENSPVCRPDGHIRRIFSTSSMNPRSSISSASSRTTKRTAVSTRMWREIRSIMRPTVATTTCAPARRRGACCAIGWPPKTATTSMSMCSAYERSAWVTWMQSSRVGVITIACSSAESGSRYWSSGSPNAAVLPVPVCAWPITSCPASSSGITCSWTGVGSSKPSSSMAV